MPFDPQREFPRCVLCDGVPVTREHLFGAKLADALDIPLSATGIGRAADGRDVAFNTGAPFLSSVSKCLCATCNNDAFHAMMGRVQPVIFKLAKGQKKWIEPGEIDDLLVYFERLGFLVDVLSSNYELTDEYRNSPHFEPHAHWHQHPPVFTLAERSAWVRKESGSVRPRVFAGRHLGVLGINPETNMSRLPSLDSLATGGDFSQVRQFHMCIGQLAIHIRMGVDVSEVDLGNAYAKLAPISTAMRWPAAMRDVDYDDFLRLYVQDENIVLWRQLFRNPIARIVQEEAIRRRHKSAMHAAKAERAAARKSSAEAVAAKDARRQAAKNSRRNG